MGFECGWRFLSRSSYELRYGGEKRGRASLGSLATHGLADETSACPGAALWALWGGLLPFYHSPVSGFQVVRRFWISSGETSSTWVQMAQRKPKGSRTMALRSP